MAGSRPRPARLPFVRILLDTNVLSEPLREQPNGFVVEQLQDGMHQLLTASVLIHELAYCVQRLSAGKKQQRLVSYLVALLESGLQVLSYNCRAALWHDQQAAQLEAEGRWTAFADGQIAAIAATNDLAMVTHNLSDFADFQGLQLLDWFSEP